MAARKDEPTARALSCTGSLLRGAASTFDILIFPAPHLDRKLIGRASSVFLDFFPRWMWVRVPPYPQE